MAAAQSEQKDLTATVLLGDAVAGGVAAFPVAPLVSAVDRALAENAAGRVPLFTSFFTSLKEMASTPIKFLGTPQFKWIWLVYAATYATANSCQTICDHQKRDVKFPKLFSTFIVNTGTCIAKDRAFAKIFGQSVKYVPPTAYGAWFIRDLGSMGVFFTLPPIVGAEINKRTGNEKYGYYTAQIVLPLACQFIFTPIHLLGYNICNNPQGTISDRITFLKKDYFKNVGLRMFRQAAPWSFGTILNMKLRGMAHQRLG